MKKRSPVDPDGGPDSGSDGDPASNGIEANPATGKDRAFSRHEENAPASAEWHVCYVLPRGHVSALTSVRLNPVSGEIYGERT
jgi:hypothetical protein